MATGIICIIIIIVCVLGIRSYTKRLTHGCCGGGQDPVKRVRPADPNIAHYPYIRKTTDRWNDLRKLCQKSRKCL